MTREIAHMRSFMLALDSMGRPPLSIGKIAPTPGLKDQYFNDSTGDGDHGELDSRGPWNEGDPSQYVESPALHTPDANDPGIHAESAPSDEGAPMRALLIDQLRDILHAEKQLLKAIQKMVKAARAIQLQTILETHLQETEDQVARLEECLDLLGVRAGLSPAKVWLAW